MREEPGEGELQKGVAAGFCEGDELFDLVEVLFREEAREAAFGEAGLLRQRQPSRATTLFLKANNRLASTRPKDSQVVPAATEDRPSIV